MRAMVLAGLLKVVGAIAGLSFSLAHAHLGDHPGFGTLPAGHPDPEASIVSLSCSHRDVKIATQGSDYFTSWHHACQDIINYCNNRSSYPDPFIRVTGGSVKYCTISNASGVGGFSKYKIISACPGGDCAVDTSNLGLAETPDAAAEDDSLESPLDSCASPDSPKMTALVGNPIDLGARNKLLVQTDYRGVGDFPLEVTWRYNSRLGLWRHTYHRYLDLSIVDRVTAHRNDGKRINFDDDGSGAWIPKVETQLSLSDISSGWQLVLGNGLIEQYDSTGKLVSIAKPVWPCSDANVQRFWIPRYGYTS